MGPASLGVGRKRRLAGFPGRVTWLRAKDSTEAQRRADGTGMDRMNGMKRCQGSVGALDGALDLSGV